MRHMLDHAREAVAMVHGRTRRDLDTDRMLQLAITRLVEIIGEAAGRVSKEGQQRYTDIEAAEHPTAGSSRVSEQHRSRLRCRGGRLRAISRTAPGSDRGRVS